METWTAPLSSLAAFVLVALVGTACNKLPDHKIVQDAKLVAEVGERYAKVLHADTYHESHGFEACQEDGPLEVEDSGLISFTPKTVGKVNLCVALTYEGERIDKYEFTVDVRPVAEEKLHARKASEAIVGRMQPKLSAMRRATRALPTPALLPCPEALASLSEKDRRLASFPEQQPNWGTGTVKQFETLEELESLAPAELALKRKVETKKELERLELVEASTHAMLYRFTDLARPKVSGDSYEGGVARGWLFIVEMDSARIVCQAPFEYRPPKSVFVESAVMMKPGESIPEGYSEVMIVKELHRNGRRAMETLLASMKPGWTILRFDDDVAE